MDGAYLDGTPDIRTDEGCGASNIGIPIISTGVMRSYVSPNHFSITLYGALFLLLKV